MENVFFGPLHRMVNSPACVCEYCNTRLRKHDGYLNVFAYQFKGPIDELSNEEKDYAMNNHGQLPGRTDYGYSGAFYGRILPPKKPFGKYEHNMNPSNPEKMYRNMYAYSNDACEAGCFTGDCREYADAMERYFQCREKCPKQDMETVTRICGRMPINPVKNGCKKNWTPNNPSPYDNHQ